MGICLTNVFKWEEDPPEFHEGGELNKHLVNLSVPLIIEMIHFFKFVASRLEGSCFLHDDFNALRKLLTLLKTH